MASPTRLTGLDLIDCARANAKQGVETAANLCGYGTDLNGFRQELEKAAQHMRIQFHELSDLIKDEHAALDIGGEIVAPDSESEL